MMEQSVQGQVAIVTGAGQGIGRGLAPKDRFGDARSSLQCSGRDDEQGGEDQDR